MSGSAITLQTALERKEAKIQRLQAELAEAQAVAKRASAILPRYSHGDITDKAIEAAVDILETWLATQEAEEHGG